MRVFDQLEVASKILLKLKTFSFANLPRIEQVVVSVIVDRSKLGEKEFLIAYSLFQKFSSGIVAKVIVTIFATIGDLEFENDRIGQKFSQNVNVS